MDFGLRLVTLLLNLLGSFLVPFLRASDSIRKGQKVPPVSNQLLLIPATELAAQIRGQKVKSEQVVRAYIDRIRQVNPIINAVVENRFEAAIQNAKSADHLCATVKSQELESKYPLLGVPFTVKESCGLQGFSHAVGSVPRKGIKAAIDGPVVANLKNAGAIPLLISNNPEFCVSWETNSLLYGVCRNPYNDKHTAGGSSGGEGALIGAGASLFGVGSDIAGSIRIPAMFNGIFGHKPTGGLFSTKGHFPNSTDPMYAYYLQTGPMCRYARDLPMLFKIMAGDNYRKVHKDTVHLKDIKVYVTDADSRKLVGSPLTAEVKNAMRKGISHFKKIGMSVSKAKFKIDIDDSLEGSLAYIVEMMDLPDMLIHPDNPKKRDNVFVELGKSFLGMPKYAFASLIYILLKDTGGFMTAPSRRVHKRRLDIFKKELLDILGDDGILIYPTMHSPAFRVHTSYSNMPGIMYSMVFNVLGFPATHVPTGFNNAGLPVGFQVVAAPYKDLLCLTAATELERAFGGWSLPA